MKIEKSFCCDVIKDNVKVINKKLFVLEKVLYNADLNDSNEFLVDIVSETIEEVKGNVNAILTVTNAMVESDEEKDIEIELLNEEIEKLKDKLNSVDVKSNFRSTRKLAKERFIQLHEEHLNTGTAPYKLCKKYHLSPSTYYKYLDMFKKGEL